MNLDMEKNVNFNMIKCFYVKIHWIWTLKMDFKLSFLVHLNVFLPNTCHYWTRKVSDIKWYTSKLNYQYPNSFKLKMIQLCIKKDNYIHPKLSTSTTKLPYTNSHNFFYFSCYLGKILIVFFDNLENQMCHSNIHSRFTPTISI